MKTIKDSEIEVKATWKKESKKETCKNFQEKEAGREFEKQVIIGEEV